MNKEQFLAAIQSRIGQLPPNDINRSLDYYGEMIDDHMEDGMTEEQAVEAMGTVDEVVSQILPDTPLPTRMKTKARRSRTLRVWEVVLLVLGFPIWGSLLLAALAILLSVYILIWSLVITLYAVDLSFAAAGVAGVAGSTILAFIGYPSQTALFQIGAGLVCIGIAILMFFASNQVTLAIVKSSRWIARRVKSLLIRKEGTK